MEYMESKMQDLIQGGIEEQAAKTYYKVVSDMNGNYRSAGLGVMSPYSVSYFLEQWTEPYIKCSFLFVFDDLESARAFAIGSQKIFECEVEGVSAAPKYRAYTDTQSINSYWSYPIGGCTTGKLMLKNTVWAKKVKLIREISAE